MSLKLKLLLPIVLCFFINSCLSSDPVDVVCRYGNLPLPYVSGLTRYSCNMQNDFPYMFNTANPIVVNKVDEGSHATNKTDASVNTLQIANRNIFQIPNLSVDFPSISYIKIHQATKLRYLEKENIGVYKSTLMFLAITNSGLEIIDRSIFEGMNRLQTIDLQNNKIFYINTDVIKDLQLSNLFLQGNDCVDDYLDPIGNYVITSPRAFSIIISILKYSSCRLPSASALVERYKNTLTTLDVESFEEQIDSNLNLMLKEQLITKFTEDIATAESKIENLTGLNNIANQKLDDLQIELETTNFTAESCKSRYNLIENTIDQMKNETYQYESTIQKLELVADKCLEGDGACRYKNDATYGYSCFAQNINITSPEQSVNWTGTHTSDASNDTSVVAMIIKDLNVEVIPKEIGSVYPRLKALIINGCGLKKLSIGDFLDMNFVKTVEITSNNISSIDSGVFDELISLEYLDLSQNGIKSLPSKIFVELSYLYSLKLDENQLTILKADFLATSNSIRYVSATNNVLTKIEGSFVWRLKGATIIDFTENNCNKRFNLTAGENFINFYSYVLSYC